MSEGFMRAFGGYVGFLRVQENQCGCQGDVWLQGLVDLKG